MHLTNTMSAWAHQQNALWKVTVTQVSRSIFKLTVARGCSEVFSNSLSHAGVQDYFQIDCRTRGSRTIFYLTIAARVQEYD